MMVSNLITEVGYLSINHDGEELCGDHVQLINNKQSRTTTLVLADGLGSGVKANILSTLTSEILSTMIANNLPIDECVKTIMETLPVCKVRGVAYSTFTIIHILDSRQAIIYNYDNPQPFLIRKGKYRPLDWSSQIIDEKTISFASIYLVEGDTFFLMSDGVIHAGIGATLNFGWDIMSVIDYAEGLFDEKYSAKSLATYLISHVNDLYNGHPGDDATVAAIKIRPRKQVNLMIGPASNREDDEKMLSLFFAKEGKHIVCGGTTSHVVANYLKKELEFPLDYIDKEIPPTAKIEGVDLVTEGVITINKVLQYADNVFKDNSDYFTWSFKQDGASQIARLLFEEATDINFFVGCAINPAHQQDGIPINFNTKMQLVDELSKALKKMNKSIKVSYF